MKSSVAFFWENDTSEYVSLKVAALNIITLKQLTLALQFPIHRCLLPVANIMGFLPYNINYTKPLIFFWLHNVLKLHWIAYQRCDTDTNLYYVYENKFTFIHGNRKCNSRKYFHRKLVENVNIQTGLTNNIFHYYSSALSYIPCCLFILKQCSNVGYCKTPFVQTSRKTREKCEWNMTVFFITELHMEFMCV